MRLKFNIGIMFLFVSTAIFWFVSGAFSEKINGYSELDKILQQSGINTDNYKTEIENIKLSVKDQFARKRKEVSFDKPIEIIPISPKYISISIEAKVKLEGATAAQEKKSVITVLMERSLTNNLEAVTFLAWSGEKDMKEYESLNVEKLCQYYREYRKVEDCYPTKQVATETKDAPKQDKAKSGFFTISADSISSGTIKADYIDPVIARDNEVDEKVKAVSSTVYTKEYVDKLNERIQKLETILMGSVQTTKDQLSNVTSLNTRIEKMEASITKLEQALSKMDKQMAQIAQIDSLLKGVSRQGDDIIFSRVNIKLNNGSGKSEGSGNGLGNLVLGYNQDKVVNTKNVSHSAVIGSMLKIQGSNPHFQ
ncbi:MAG: hypothetical protein HQK77_02350 [Desulfobacterales bacterium]|nr:hypothetical protein [Desulfobacterales bacterium]